MDSGILAALIGGVASIIVVVLGWALPNKKHRPKASRSVKDFYPDKDDVYFMQILLHDAYEQDTPISTKYLCKHHLDYTPFELEIKLINLEKEGFIRRIKQKNESMGWWNMTPKGVTYMFENKLYLEDLIEEQKNEKKYSI